MRRIGICLAAFAFVMLAAGLVDTLRAGDDKGTTLTEKDSGKKIEIKKGETLTLKLEMIAGTGFTWIIAKNDKEQLVPGKSAIIPGKKGVVGAKATQVFPFKAEAAGTSELELHYKRVFEKDKEPAKKFKVTVEIK